MKIGQNYNSALGFVRRPGVRISALEAELSPRPKFWGIRDSVCQLWKDRTEDRLSSTLRADTAAALRQKTASQEDRIKALEDTVKALVEREKGGRQGLKAERSAEVQGQGRGVVPSPAGRVNLRA